MVPVLLAVLIPNLHSDGGGKRLRILRLNVTHHLQRLKRVADDLARLVWVPTRGSISSRRSRWAALPIQSYSITNWTIRWRSLVIGPSTNLFGIIRR